MGVRLPFTRAERRRATQSTRLDYRPVNYWGDGDLPCPFAEGDVLFLSEDAYRAMSPGQRDRLRGMGPGHYVVTYACSIDEGDAWYMRVWDGQRMTGSDRMHVAYPERSHGRHLLGDRSLEAPGEGWLSLLAGHRSDLDGWPQRGRLDAAVGSAHGPAAQSHDRAHPGGEW